MGEGEDKNYFEQKNLPIPILNQHGMLVNYPTKILGLNFYLPSWPLGYALASVTSNSPTYLHHNRILQFTVK